MRRGYCLGMFMTFGVATKRRSKDIPVLSAARCVTKRAEAMPVPRTSAGTHESVFFQLASQNATNGRAVEKNS